METKELEEILAKYSKGNSDYGGHEYWYEAEIIEAMQEVAKLSHNNAIRLVSESMPKKCGCSDGCCYDADYYTSIILELLKS